MSVTVAHAQGQSRGDASLRAEYQYIRTGNFFDNSPVFGSGGDVGHTDSHVLLLSGAYAVHERWVLYAALPYVMKRHRGTNPHDGSEFTNFVPPDPRIVDDGDYHGGFQDLTLGLQYNAQYGPVSVSPYISYGTPVRDYPIYGKAIIGPNLWTVPVGVDLYYIPYFSDWHFRADLAYVFSEEPLDVNVDYWLAYLSAGYYFTPRLSVDLFVSAKYILDGLEMPLDFTDDPTYGDYPEDFDNERWWQHDRLLGHRFANVGLGIDYILDERYQLSASWFTGVWAEQTNEVEYAFTIGVTRLFGGD